MIVLPRLFALLLLGRGSADDLHDLSHPSWDRLEATWDRLAVDARRAFPRALQTVGSSYSYSYSYSYEVTSSPTATPAPTAANERSVTSFSAIAGAMASVAALGHSEAAIVLEGAGPFPVTAPVAITAAIDLRLTAAAQSASRRRLTSPPLPHHSLC